MRSRGFHALVAAAIAVALVLIGFRGGAEAWADEPAAPAARPPAGAPTIKVGAGAPTPGRPAAAPPVQGKAPVAAAAPAGDAAAATPRVPADRDQTESSGKGMAVMFWLFALGTLGGSVFVLTRRNLIAAVMGMVGTFFGIAALYMLLYAHFLAVIQMLVYAGAIMVLFVFVVMILNKPEDEPWGVHGLVGRLGAGVSMLAVLYLVVRLGATLWSVKPPESALAAPAAVLVQDGVGANRQPTFDSFDWGSTGAVGSNLFTEYVFPFEAISLLLLVAVVGAIAVARPLKEDEEDAAAGAREQEA